MPLLLFKTVALGTATALLVTLGVGPAFAWLLICLCALVIYCAKARCYPRGGITNKLIVRILIWGAIGHSCLFFLYDWSTAFGYFSSSPPFPDFVAAGNDLLRMIVASLPVVTSLTVQFEANGYENLVPLVGNIYGVNWLLTLIFFVLLVAFAEYGARAMAQKIRWSMKDLRNFARSRKKLKEDWLVQKIGMSAYKKIGIVLGVLGLTIVFKICFLSVTNEFGYVGKNDFGLHVGAFGYWKVAGFFVVLNALLLVFLFFGLRQRVMRLTENHPSATVLRR